MEASERWLIMKKNVIKRDSNWMVIRNNDGDMANVMHIDGGWHGYYRKNPKKWYTFFVAHLRMGDVYDIIVQGHRDEKAIAKEYWDGVYA